MQVMEADRYRRELPRFLRARVYVIRGLNVSGARHAGFVSVVKSNERTL